MAIESYGQWEIEEAPAIDERGRPTTYLCFRILRMMYNKPRHWFTPKKLSVLLAAKYGDTDMICRQLNEIDFLSRNPSEPGQYRYNLDSENANIQIGFEKYLLDVQLHRLPVHVMLDYSPSCRWPRGSLSTQFE